MSGSEADIVRLTRPEKPKRGRGRPPNSERFKYELQERSLERDDFIKEHALVLANPSPEGHNSAVDRLLLVKHQMAREAAALEFNKRYLDLEGKDTSTVSSRIVGILQKMSDIDLEVKKLGHTIVDPRSEEVQKMAGLWVSTLTDVLTAMVKSKTLDTQTMDLLISKFAEALEGWEDRIDGDN